MLDKKGNWYYILEDGKWAIRRKNTYYEILRKTLIDGDLSRHQDTLDPLFEILKLVLLDGNFDRAQGIPRLPLTLSVRGSFGFVYLDKKDCILSFSFDRRTANIIEVEIGPGKIRMTGGLAPVSTGAEALENEDA